MKKKRGLKTQLLVMSLVLTYFLSSFSYVLAQGNEDINYLNFTHGQMSQIYYYDPMNMNVLQFNFDKNYSGTVRVNFSYNANILSQNLDYWDILVDGAKIDQYFNNSSNSYIVFHVYNVQFFTVTMVYHKTGTISSDDIRFKFTSASSSLTDSTDPIATDVDSIDTKLTTTNSTLSTISSRLQSANGYLVDIITNTSDIESYMSQQFNGQNDSDVEQLLASIQLTQGITSGNISDCENLLNDIKSQINIVNSAIGSPNSTQDDIVTCLNNISGYQHDIETTLSDIYDEIVLMSTTLNNISTTLNNILSTVQNIDNLIDTISWQTMNSTVLWGTTPDFQNTSSNAIVSNTYKKLYFYINGDENLYVNRIYRFQLGINSNSNLYGITIKPYGVVVGGRVYQKEFNTYIQYFKNSTEIFVYPDNDLSLSSGSYFMFEVETNNYIRYAYNYNSIGYLPSEDIEYWQLMSYFKQVEQYSQVNKFNESLYQKLDQIIDAINGINVSDDDISLITDNFDNDIDTIHNIENNFGLDFDGWDDQLTSSDISLDLTGYNDTINLFKTNITTFWASPFISLPILFGVLSFVFLIILG